MRTTLSLLTLGLSVLFLSCKKDNFLPDDHESKTSQVFKATQRGAGGSAGGDISTPIPFGLLGLNNGSFTINSANNLIADVGYGNGVTSTTNQKVNNFTGTAGVHSQVKIFKYASSTFNPVNGIQRNNAEIDAKLDMANANAIAASANYSSLTPDVVLGNVTKSTTLNSAQYNTVVNISSLDYNASILNLRGNAGEDNGFIINVLGNFNFSQSEIRLTNVRPERVIFNFPNASNIVVNKASTIFRGTILAPVGNVIYHNPASFEGAIVALNIAAHSNFNLTQKLFTPGN